jgi:hypothetical protein
MNSPEIESKNPRLCEQNSQVYADAGGTYSYHCALNLLGSCKSGDLDRRASPFSKLAARPLGGGSICYGTSNW